MTQKHAKISNEPQLQSNLLLEKGPKRESRTALKHSTISIALKLDVHHGCSLSKTKVQAANFF